MNRLLLPAMLTLLAIHSVRAEEPASPSSAFEQGLAARDRPATARAAFATAAEGFDDLWRSGQRTPDVARARGRAHFLAGDLPRAIRAYHDGLALAPYDDDLRRGLAHCRTQVAYPTEPDPAQRMRPRPITGLRTRIAPADLFFAALVGSLVLTVGLARRFTAADRWAVPVAALGCLGLVVTAAAALQIERETDADGASGMRVVSRDVTLRTGNGSSYPPRLDNRLPRGAEVRERASRGGWIQVELSGGALGWLPEADLLRTDEP